MTTKTEKTGAPKPTDEESVTAVLAARDAQEAAADAERTRAAQLRILLRPWQAAEKRLAQVLQEYRIAHRDWERVNWPAEAPRYGIGPRAVERMQRAVTELEGLSGAGVAQLRAFLYEVRGLEGAVAPAALARLEREADNVLGFPAAAEGFLAELTNALSECKARILTHPARGVQPVQTVPVELDAASGAPKTAIVDFPAGLTPRT